jgi:hypothetical protein
MTEWKMDAPHQLDRIEDMLVRLTNSIPSDGRHVLRREVSINIIEMFRFMREGRKIEAIKAHRALTGLGLKESKDEIESIMARMLAERAA